MLFLTTPQNGRLTTGRTGSGLVAPELLPSNIRQIARTCRLPPLSIQLGLSTLKLDEEKWAYRVHT